MPIIVIELVEIRVSILLHGTGRQATEGGIAT
jgi:hypothetical protein